MSLLPGAKNKRPLITKWNVPAQGTTGIMTIGELAKNVDRTLFKKEAKYAALQRSS